jgi:hypothetical protein
MKFLSFTMYNIDKLAEVAKAADKLATNPPEGYKILAIYSCQSNPFPGVELPPGTMVTASILECESAEAMASANLEITLAGGTISRIPILEVSTGGAEETVERLKA